MRDGTIKSRVGPWSYRVDPYSPAKITENRVHSGNWPVWAVFGSEFTTVDPDGILRQGQRLPTPNSPPEGSYNLELTCDANVCPKDERQHTRTMGQAGPARAVLGA
ncbi:hypothetical protein CRG98_029430 [Punica granatum]|uniref:Uncharacterized protein n=1 Tax=Punica granatum TaxID=22663 RepID=A0A2I0J385_PUNGR|nr:hypothetical protein CRG98_029430 [Punica granatum]